MNDNNWANLAPTVSFSSPEKTPFMKIHSAKGLSEKFSPIVARQASIKKENAKDSLENKKRNKRNPWTKEEDVRLTELVQRDMANTKIPGINYVNIASALKSGRTGKQCRDRWNNFLRDGIKKGKWTMEEEDLIKELFLTFGPKWSCMAKLFKDRTDNDIKNKWYSMKRKDERNGTNECEHSSIRQQSSSVLPIKTDYSISSSSRKRSTPVIFENGECKESTSV